MVTSWHSLSLHRVFEELKVSEQGLSVQEARERLTMYGANTLPEEKSRSLILVFFSQFQSPLIYLLLFASAIVFSMGETADGSIILAVLLFNAIVGTIQEGRAQNTLRALKSLVETQATVLRDGREIVLSDREVVPGDILILQEGEKVPADARVITSKSIAVDEASLTGESTPVHKIVDALPKEELSVAAQKNMLFKGTHIVSGNGKAVVVATGLETAIGKVAKQISALDTEVPLKANIRALSRAIIAVVALTSTVLFTAGILLGHSVKEMFTTVVALSVAVIPEGLPIVLTLVLATGVWRMSKRNVLVKKLQAVEALGQARVIAVDKTGTITKNELVVRKVWTEGKMFEIGGSGYEPTGELKLEGAVVDSANHEELLFTAKLASLSANARITYAETEKTWRVAGDPTEAAMLVFAEKVGFHKNALLIESPLLSEIPFDYKLKYRATVNREGDSALLTVVGAPETVLRLCEEIRRGGKNHRSTPADHEALERTHARMSEEGLRVLAIAVRHTTATTLVPEAIHSLSFVGFIGMQDTVRSEVAEAMRRAEAAGVHVVMITGDHKITARAIAREAGIYREGDMVLTGEEMESMSPTELAEKLDRTTVFARVTPEHKVLIINAYKARGEIVAMTGDGVNDAPSLVAADLGVAMGKIGTEVAKEAADIILLDDNFGSIVSAIEEGRSIYKTIKKVILYLFSTGAGLVLTISVALFLGYPLPILAAQIIWLNFVTGGFLDMSLAMEPKEKGLLTETFERPKKYLVDRLMVVRMIVMALPMMAGTLYLFAQYADTDLAKALTVSLTVLAVFQWFNVWNCRSESRSVFRMNPFSNKFLVGATVLVIFLQMLAIYNPILQKVLHTVPLAFSEWLVIIPIAASIVLVEEIRKFFFRRKLVHAT